MIRKGLVIGIIILFVGASFIQVSAGDFNSVYGYLYINDEIAPSGVLVKIIFTEDPEEIICETDSNGYFQLDFAGHNWEKGYFSVKYEGYWYTPEGNPYVEIVPDEIGYEIDLYIIVSYLEIVYVDDDFDENTSGWGYDHFDKIQDGVDAVAVGGTVYVYNGTYYENIIIDKSINLIGENRDTTIIDANGIFRPVSIIEDNVNISGFTTQNSGDDPAYAGIYTYTDYNIIKDNKVISNGKNGIFLSGDANYNKVENNSVNSNDGDGIIIHYSSDYNLVSGNFIRTNSEYGIRVSDNSGHNIIKNNYVISNNDNGIILKQSSKNNSIIENFIISHNDWGLQIVESDGNIVLGNNISLNNKGLYLRDAHDNQIKNNDILSNRLNGILVKDSSSDNIISGNTFNDNDCGVFIYDSSNYNRVYHNNFYDNNNNGWDNCNNSWDNGSEGNYWDDYTGVDNDGDGIGDTPYNLSGGSNQDLYPLMYPMWDNPPDVPMIDGPNSGKPGVEYFYKLVSNDPDGDDVRFLIDWGDGNEEMTNYCPSGDEEIRSHIWNESGVYTIKAKAKDIWGAESDWTEFTVTMPRNKAVTSNMLLQSLLERFPLLQRLSFVWRSIVE